MGRFFTGNTGRSTGPHLDLRVYNPATGGYEDPSSYTSYLSTGQGAFNFPVTSGYQPGGRVHPVTGKVKPHHGIDYATPTGTELSIDGQHMSTWRDSGGGVMSQYLINTEDGHRELLLLHGSDQNKITGSGALTDYDPETFSTVPLETGKPTPVPTKGSGSPEPQVEAKTRAQAFKAFNASDVVKNFGNDFGEMKSSRLADALKGAQEDIVQKRMDKGINFGGKNGRCR